MQSSFNRTTRVCLVAILSMLIVTACQGNSINPDSMPQTNDQEPVEPTNNIIPENTSSMEVIPTEEGLNDDSHGVEISYVNYPRGIDGMYTVENGWANYKGILVFYNHENSALTLELNNSFESESSVVIDTAEGEQYEGTINVVAPDGRWLYQGGRSSSLYLPQKTPLVKFPETYFPAFNILIEFQVPELLHLTKITISDVFSLPDGTTEFIIDEFFTTTDQWATQYPVTTTGGLPANIKFSDGVEMQIQSEWEKINIGGDAKYSTMCLRANVKNTDITGDANFEDKDFRLVFSFGDGDYFSRAAIGYEVWIYNTEESSFMSLGPGQQRDVLLCVADKYNDYFSSGGDRSDMQIVLSHFESSEVVGHFLLSISGEGVEELLNAPKN